MAEKATLLLLVGGWGSEGAVERALSEAHRAAARDLLAVLLDTGLIDRAVVATDDVSWSNALADMPVEIDADSPGEPFHFGRRLAGLIDRHRVHRVLYCGGGSAPLLSAESWLKVLVRLGEAERLVVTNNVHSCDWVGIVPAEEAAASIAGQVRDNAVAWALAGEGGFPCESLPPSAASRFDLDTPIDLLIARQLAAVGPSLRRFLGSLPWHAPQVDGALSVMTQEGGDLVVAGRVSAAAWMALERATRCRVRVFAEERGMRASGRLERGEVRSLLADHVKRAGVEGFFERMADLADAVLLDSRVIFAARRLQLSRSDRFASDLGRWNDVQDPFLRRFTRAAVTARIPVVLGGHTVVSGGLMALVESLASLRGRS